MKTNDNTNLPKNVATTYERHGRDFYKRIGAIGGHNSHLGGFQEGSELSKEAGRKGGLKSRRSFHYQYTFTQVRGFNPKACGTRKGYQLANVALGFGIEQRKYASCKHDALSQKKWHTIHKMSSLPLNVAVPIYLSIEPYWYVVVCENGKVYDPQHKFKYLKDIEPYAYGWAEYLDGEKIIKKERV